MTVAMETRDGEPHYSPHIIWIESGGTAIFDTKAGTHTATAYHHGNGTVDRVPVDAPAWDSGTVTAEDEPYKRTFDVPGVHDFYCIPHEGQGMVGTVIVGEPENTDQPGLAKPQDELSSGAYSKIETLNDTVLGEVDSLR